MGTIEGRCKFKECNSLCCRQFRLYYPRGEAPVPPSPRQKNFLYPKNKLEEITRMSGGDYMKLLAWRGIKLYYEQGELQMVFPHAQNWSFTQTDEHDIIILPDVPCRYLRDNGTCKIHQRKPSICKDFPRGPDEIPETCGYRWVE